MTESPSEPLQPFDEADLRARHTHAYDYSHAIDFVPQRVVSLVPSLTESLFELNLGQRVVGVTDYCIYPEAARALPKVGGTKNPDIEKIKALAPDLVMLNSEENRREDADALQAAGIPIWVTQPNSVREAIELLWEIMEVFEEASMVHRVRLIEITYETMRRYAEQNPPVRAFVPIWRDPWMTFNAQTFAHDLLFTCGALNVFAARERQFPLAADLGKAEPLAADDPRRAGRDTRYPRITLEEVEAAQPEIILLPTEPYAFSEADALAFDGLDVPAVRNGHIYIVEGSWITWHGTRMARAFRHLPPVIAAARDNAEVPPLILPQG
ncbi:MAG: ABC transporter substrate-binding protein [Chloroflexota bacterium]|nr:MAG: ABC transporter substrate-binding protein [Chloroflexota bacterium]